MSGDARDFNNMETRAVIKFPPSPLQFKAPNDIHTILTEALACFLRGRAKDLSAPLYMQTNTILITSRSVLLTARNVSNRNCRENHNKRGLQDLVDADALSLSCLVHNKDEGYGDFTMNAQTNSCTQLVKGKTIPLQARCGPEGGQRYSYTLP